MALTKDVKEIKKTLQRIEEVLTGVPEEMIDLEKLEKEYKQYKFFADNRGEKLLAEQGLLDEYNTFMTECEEILFADDKVSTFTVRIELPKPSSALEAFKNRFNKFF